MGSEQEVALIDISQFRELFKAYFDQQSFRQSPTSEILSFLDKSLAKSIVPAAQHSPCPSGDTESKNSGMKKRKKMQKSSSQKTIEVKVGTGDSVEERLRDTYSWRKYGQKNIQHAHYPRAYFRCSHRDTRGCIAKKQIQQLCENPPVFEVSYIRTHTCDQRPQLKQDNLADDVQQQPDLLPGFHNSLMVKTEASQSFSFPPTPVNFLDYSAIPGSLSPSLISPATSGTNYFSVSPCGVNNYGEGSSKQREECSFEEMIAMDSAANSPFESLDDMLDLSCYFDEAYELQF